MLRLKNKAATFERMLPTLAFKSGENSAWRKLQKNGQFPDEPVRITV
jgi:hypothetical protein